jgi:hypothetical protein
MPDFLSGLFERTLKAVRFGIFQASDQLALALDGLCRAPEVYPRYEMTAPLAASSSQTKPSGPLTPQPLPRLRLLRPPRSRAATAAQRIATFPPSPAGPPHGTHPRNLAPSAGEQRTPVVHRPAPQAVREVKVAPEEHTPEPTHKERKVPSEPSRF